MDMKTKRRVCGGIGTALLLGAAATAFGPKAAFLAGAYFIGFGMLMYWWLGPPPQ